MTDSLSALRHGIKPNEDGEACAPHEIYRSSNGDVWELIRAKAPEHNMVRHTPAPSSGGETSLVTIEKFLAMNCSGPEHAALRILLDKAEASPTEL